MPTYRQPHRQATHFPSGSTGSSIPREPTLKFVSSILSPIWIVHLSLRWIAHSEIYPQVAHGRNRSNWYYPRTCQQESIKFIQAGIPILSFKDSVSRKIQAVAQENS